jgi:hypothetical protein
MLFKPLDDLRRPRHSREVVEDALPRLVGQALSGFFAIPGRNSRIILELAHDPERVTIASDESVSRQLIEERGQPITRAPSPRLEVAEDRVLVEREEASPIRQRAAHQAHQQVSRVQGQRLHSRITPELRVQV